MSEKFNQQKKKKRGKMHGSRKLHQGDRREGVDKDCKIV